MSDDDTHLSIDQLADLGADLMTPADVAAAQAHLRSCETCRGTQELLGGVPALLASLEPSPIPADVTARVVAAIEREQIARAGDAEGAVDPARSRPERAGFRRRFGARLGAGLLGATAVLGGGYVLVSGVLGGGDSDSPTSAGTAEGADERALDSGAGAPTDFANESAYTAASLEQDVLRLLAQAPAAPDAERTPRDTAVLGEDGQVGEPDDVRTKACVAATQRKAGSEADPLAVDIGTYEGLPAVVIVLPEGGSGSGAAPLDVWVVSAGCVDADEDAVPQLSRSLEVLRHKTVLP